MPADPISLILYVIMLVPGVTFVVAKERRRPSMKRSSFRETATVVIASAVAISLVVAVALVIGIWVPQVHAWIHEFLTDPSALMEQDPIRFLIVCLSAMAAITSFAALVGTFPRSGKEPKNKIVRALLASSTAIKPDESGWHDAFIRGTRGENPDRLVSVYLKNGGWLQGLLQSYNPAAEDDPNRALVLTRPLMYRNPTAKFAVELDTTNVVVVNASEIYFLTVTFYPEGSI